MWDTAGYDHYFEPGRYYRRAEGIILVYDITDSQSYDKINHYLEEIGKFADPSVDILLIGNKIDLESERVVDTSKAKTFADEHNILFMETSAKSGANVEEAFTMLVRKIFERVLNSPEANNNPKPIELDRKEETKGTCY